MSTPRSGQPRIVLAALVGFVAGAIGVAVMVWHLPNLMNWMNGPRASPRQPPVRHDTADRKDLPTMKDGGGQRVLESRPTAFATPPPVAGPPIASSETSPISGTESVTELRHRQLALPVRGVLRPALRDSFYETRGSARGHEAIDIMAPRNTAVLAVEGGTIAKLFESKPGGTTVYQFDLTSRYMYYYAHLERYADGLREGNRVLRGDVLGYVGTSGNAPKDAPHLHFAIFRITDAKHWWQGSPIDPYEVFK